MLRRAAETVSVVNRAVEFHDVRVFGPEENLSVVMENMYKLDGTMCYGCHIADEHGPDYDGYTDEELDQVKKAHFMVSRQPGLLGFFKPRRVTLVIGHEDW